MRITLNDEQWVLLYTELSSMFLELSDEEKADETLTVIDEEGNESYTEEAQDKFNKIVCRVESVLISVGITKS